MLEEEMPSQNKEEVLHMKQVINRSIGLAVVVAAAGVLFDGRAGAQDLTAITGEQGVHGMPLPAGARFDALQTAGTPLLYHGGPVMTTTTTYAIFWAPSGLQNGQATSLPASYQNIQSAFLRAYPGHGIANNSTQYYMTSGSGSTQVKTYVRNVGAFGGSYVDTSAYPSSGCSDSVTPGNCLSDAQIQAEVQKVMALKNWTGGLNHMFFVYTSSGEGSCSGSGCAYTDYCAYHGYFLNGSTPVIYGNEPYAAAGYCQAGSSPNGDAAGDAAASITSHELTEAITDPELNAWYTSGGSEIGDICAWNYGSNTWNGGKANEFWPISYTVSNSFGMSFELQQEYDNHTAICVQVGP
jgi:hypothetical protein